MNSPRFIKNNIRVFILLAFFAAIYTLTIFPGVGGRINYGDSAKWQFLWAVGGTPHSTGYPLYLLLTKLFGNILVFLEPATRITAISLVSGIATLFVIYKISEIFISTKAAQILPSLMLGGAYVFWSQSTEAEVYTLNALFVSLVIYYSIKFFLTKSRKYFLITMAIYALSFGNHLTMITLLPGLIYLVAITDYRIIFSKKVVLSTIAIFIASASQYLYLLYLSHTGSLHLEYIGENASIRHWLSYITGGQFRSQIGGNGLRVIFNKSMPDFLAQFWNSAGLSSLLILLHLVFFQKIKLGNSYNKIIVFLFLIGLGELVYALSYDIGDIVVYYIPVLMVLALLVTKSLDIIPQNMSKRVLVSALILSNIFLIFCQFESMKVSSNPLYSSVSCYFKKLPDNATLYIPRKGAYLYAGHEAVKYAQYLDFAGKNISHFISLDNDYAEFYLPSEFVNDIPSDEYILASIEQPVTLYDLLQNHKDDLIIISGRDESQNGLSSKTKESLLAFGLNINRLKYRGSYVAIINNNQVIAEEINNKGTAGIENEKLRIFGIDEVSSAGLEFGNYSKIVINGENMSLNKRGLNIVIMIEDNEIKQYNIDTHDTDLLESIIYKAVKVHS